jgi:hypothetical protein
LLINGWLISDGTFLIVGIHMFFQVSYSSDTEQLDDVVSECVSDDDDFVIAYAALELMDDKYDSHAKFRTMHVMPGIVSAEI